MAEPDAIRISSPSVSSSESVMKHHAGSLDAWIAAGLCGSALVATEPCAFSAQYLIVDEARRLCFSSAQDFEPLPLRAGTTRCWLARGPSGPIGYAFADAVIGKHMLIDYMLAVDPAGNIQRLEILSYRESYGGQVRNPSWRRQFQGFGASNPPRFQRDVMNIGGATLSCRHVTEGVARLLAIFKDQVARHGL